MRPSLIFRLFTGKGKLNRALRLCVTAGLLVGLWHLTDGPDVIDRLLRAEWPWLVPALVAAHLQILLSALRWRLTAAQLGQPMRRRDAISEYYLSQLINLTVPGGVLGDAGRAVRQRHQAGLMRAAQAVVIERMVGQIALFGVLFVGFGSVFLWPSRLVLPSWLADIVGWLALGTVGLLGVGAALWLMPGGLSRLTTQFAGAVRVAVLAQRVWPRQVILSLVIVACNLGSFAFCAAATGTDLPLAAVVTVLPLILTAMMLPVSVGGWGLREGAAATFWPVIGASAEAGIAASITFGVVILVASLPGLWVLMTRLGGRPAGGPIVPAGSEAELQEDPAAKHE